MKKLTNLNSSIDLKALRKDSVKTLTSIEKNEDLESQITKNFLTISYSYLKIHNVNNFKYGYKKKNVLSELQEIEGNYKKSIANALQNLKEIAIRVKPDSFSNDVEALKDFLQSLDENYLIFPQEGTIVLACIFPYNQKQVIFSTVYSKETQEKYLNVLGTEILPGRYDLGYLVQGNVVSDFKKIFENKDSLDSVIDESSVISSYIQVIPKEDIPVARVKDIVISSLKDSVSSFSVRNNSILLKLKKLPENKVYSICKKLKVNMQDVYKLLNI